jgi:hypothetical protein
LGGFLGDRSR